MKEGSVEDSFNKVIVIFPSKKGWSHMDDGGVGEAPEVEWL